MPGRLRRDEGPKRLSGGEATRAEVPVSRPPSEWQSVAFCARVERGSSERQQRA